jgi:hypothetical protein
MGRVTPQHLRQSQEVGRNLFDIVTTDRILARFVEDDQYSRDDARDTIQALFQADYASWPFDDALAAISSELDQYNVPDVREIMATYALPSIPPAHSTPSSDTSH